MTITRANGSDLGSFVDEGFRPASSSASRSASPSDDVELDGRRRGHRRRARSLATALPVAPASVNATSRSATSPSEGLCEGAVDVRARRPDWPHHPLRPAELARRRLPRGPVRRGLHDAGGDAGVRPLQDRHHPRRRTRRRTTSSSSRADRRPTRRACRRPARTRERGHAPRRGRDFTTTDWYVEQTVVLEADVAYAVPIIAPGREGLPGLHAPALQAARPARRRGRRHRRRPLAEARPQAAGREGRPAVRDRHAAAGVQADRRAEHLQRRLASRTAAAR